MLSVFVSESPCVCVWVCGRVNSTLNGWLWETSDFALSFVVSVAVRENDKRLSPPVCWLIYCSPTHRWEINGKPSVRRQYNKWPIQASTYSAPEGSPRSPEAERSNQSALSVSFRGADAHAGQTSCDPVWQCGKCRWAWWTEVDQPIPEDSLRARAQTCAIFLLDIHNVEKIEVNKWVCPWKKASLDDWEVT